MILEILFATGACFAFQSEQASLREAMERANALVMTGKLAQALPLLRKAVDAARMNGTSEPELARAIDALGSMHHHERRLSEAARYHREAIWILESRPDGQPAIAQPLINLARVRLTEGRLTEGERLLVRAEEALNIEIPARTKDLVVIATLLAEVNIKKGRYREAEQYGQRALEGLKSVRGMGPYRAIVLFHLATIARDQGMKTTAESLLRQAIAAWEESLGRRHPTCVSGIVRLAIMISQSKPVEAESLFREITSSNLLLESNHPENSAILTAYARFLRSQRRKREAKVLEKRAKSIDRRFPVETRPRHTVDLSALETAKHY